MFPFGSLFFFARATTLYRKETFLPTSPLMFISPRYLFRRQSSIFALFDFAFNKCAALGKPVPLHARQSIIFLAMASLFMVQLGGANK
jgi:hypothetical protein